MLIKTIKLLSAPVTAIGFLWYMFIQTPFHQGQMKAFSALLNAVLKEDKDSA